MGAGAQLSGLRTALLATPWACKGHRRTEAVDVPQPWGSLKSQEPRSCGTPGPRLPLPDSGSTLGILEDKA